MNRKTIWIVGVMALAFILTAGVVFGQSGFRGWTSGDMPWNGSFRDRGDHGRMHGRDNRGMHGGTMPGTDIAFESEADYLAMMIPHHEEAVVRSKELLELTDENRMVELLESVIAEQTAEIELMEGWLAENYPDHEPRSEYEPMMRPYDGLSGDEAELVFIEDMIPHHMHAIMSSRSLLRYSEEVSAETRELASSIIVSQRDEIHLMHDLYAELTPDDSTQPQRRRPRRGMPGMMGSARSQRGMMGMMGSASACPMR